LVTFRSLRLSHPSRLPAKSKYNRLNAYNTYLLMAQEGMKKP